MTAIIQSKRCNPRLLGSNLRTEYQQGRPRRCRQGKACQHPHHLQTCLILPVAYSMRRNRTVSTVSGQTCRETAKVLLGPVQRRLISSCCCFRQRYQRPQRRISTQADPSRGPHIAPVSTLQSERLSQIRCNFAHVSFPRLDRAASSLPTQWSSGPYDHKCPGVTSSETCKSSGIEALL